MEWRNRIIGYDTKPASQFTPNPSNWRVHPSIQREALRGLLGDVGWVGAVLENKQTGNLIDGHARIEEALSQDDNTLIPYLLVDLSPDEEKLVLASFDPISALATSDKDKLESLLKEVSGSSEAVDSLLSEIAKKNGVLLDSEPKDAEPQIDKAAELQQKWGTETGQLWVIGNHRLLVGDATNKADVGRLCANVGVDAVVTDPPYGIGVDKAMHEKGGQRYGKAAAPKKHYAATNWDSAQPPDETIKWLASCAPQAVIWGGNYFNLPPARCYLVWDKQNDGNQFADCELAWTNLDKPVRLIRHLWNGMLRAGKEERLSHPTQKPLEVIMWAINQLDGSPATILDTYCGVGTTAIAAENLGRQCLAMDIAPEYVACSLERLSTAFPHLKIEKVDQARAA